MEERTLSTVEVANLLKCSDDTVRRLIEKGKLPASRLHDTGFWRIAWSDLKEYAKEQHIPISEE